jgi:hypothetical protein
MFGVALIAALAASAPTYLSCTLQDGETKTLVDLTVDEVAQNVTIEQKTTGRLVSRAAVFSPTEVRVPDQPSTWVVDRVTLALQRVVKFSNQQFVDHGQCKVSTTPAKRAF